MKWIDSYQKKHKWPLLFLEAVKHPCLSGKYKFKLVWDTTLPSQSVRDIGAGDNVRKEEPFIHCWWVGILMQPLLELYGEFSKI